MTTEKDSRNHRFEEVNPLYAYMGTFRSKTVEGAYHTFGPLFETAEEGKTYKVYVGNTAWVTLDKYLLICNEAYKKSAKFVMKEHPADGEHHIRTHGYTMVTF